MSAFAALAVASPAAVVAISDLSERTEPPAQHRQFVQAAMITDLPNELMSALSQGLSQFGINLPPLPTGLLTGSGSAAPTTLTSPGLGMAPMTTAGLGTSPLTTPGLGTTPMTTPGVGLPSASATLSPDALTNPALTPALASPTGVPSLGTLPATPGGLTTPPTALTTSPTLDPALASPISNAAGLPNPGEVPIAAPIGLDPAAGTYPLLGDPSLAAAPATSGSGGIFGDLSSMASQLGAGQAIDLLKGMVMPAIMSAVKPAGAPAADAAAAATSAVPAAAAALPAAAAALPAGVPAIPGL
jgi:hypothetical protein